MVSFVSSLFLGTESKHNIAGIKIIFGNPSQQVLNQKSKEKHSVSDLVHECFINLFSLATFKPTHSFISAMGYLLAHKMAGNRITQLSILNTQIGASVENNISKSNIERTIRIGVVIHLAFELLLILGAKVLVGYITKPVAALIAGTSLFWMANRILKQTNMKSVRLDSVSYGWKGNIALVTTYALSLFAAYKMI